MTEVIIAASSVVASGAAPTNWSAKGTFAIPPVLAAILQPNGTAGSMIAVGFSSASAMRAEGFTPQVSGSIGSVATLLSKVGSPTDDVVLRIYASSGSNLPTGSVLGTSDPIAGSSLLTSPTLQTFTFSSPVAVTGGVKYHFALARSGSTSGSNYFQLQSSGANTDGSVGVSSYNGSSWSSIDTNELLFAVYGTGINLYQVTQDSGGSPKVHIWKSTDNGASWAEIDAAHAITVNSGASPFSADYDLAQGLSVGYFSGTNTVRLRSCNIMEGASAWASTDHNNANASTDADTSRSIRVDTNAQDKRIFYTSLADDADISVAYRGISGWSTAPALAVTSGESSLIADVAKERTSASRFASAIWYDVANDDFAVRTLTVGTFGTETDLDSTIATTENGHATANYTPYVVSGADTIVAAYIDANNSIQERVLTLGFTSASIPMATQHQVTSSTSYAGKHLATCKYDSDLYVFGSTGTGIDYFVDVGATGSWSAATNWKSGLTNCYLSSVTPIDGVGILVVYNDNGDVKCDLVGAAAVDATGTISADVIAISGQSIVATAGSVGTITQDTVPITGNAVIGQVNFTGTITQDTIPISGQTVAGVASSTGAITSDVVPISGQLVFSPGDEVGFITADVLAIIGLLVAADPRVLGSITPDSIPITGSGVAAESGSIGSISSDAIPIIGISIGGSSGSVALISPDTVPLSGSAVAGVTGSTATISPDSVPISGVAVQAASGTIASIASDAVSINGSTVSATSGTTGDIISDSIPITGNGVVVDDGGNNDTGAISSSTIPISGSSIEAMAGATASLITDLIDITGSPINASFGSVGSVASGSLGISSGGLGGFAGTTALILTSTVHSDGGLIFASSGSTGFIFPDVVVVSGQTIIGLAGSTAIIIPSFIITSGGVILARDHALGTLNFAIQGEYPLEFVIVAQLIMELKPSLEFPAEHEMKHSQPIEFALAIQSVGDFDV